MDWLAITRTYTSWHMRAWFHTSLHAHEHGAFLHLLVRLTPTWRRAPMVAWSHVSTLATHSRHWIPRGNGTPSPLQARRLRQLQGKGIQEPIHIYPIETSYLSNAYKSSPVQSNSNSQTLTVLPPIPILLNSSNVRSVVQPDSSPRLSSSQQCPLSMKPQVS